MLLCFVSGSVSMLIFSMQLALEKEELRIHLQASKDAQRQLTAEVDTHFIKKT